MTAKMLSFILLINELPFERAVSKFSAPIHLLVLFVPFLSQKGWTLKVMFIAGALVNDSTLISCAPASA